MQINENNFLKNIIDNIKPNEVYQVEFVTAIQLSVGSWRNYCPYCRDRFKRGEGENWKQNLKPLWKYVYRLIVSNDGLNGRYIFENQYKCECCKKTFKESELISAYIKPYEENSFIDLTKLKNPINCEEYRW